MKTINIVNVNERIRQYILYDEDDIGTKMLGFLLYDTTSKTVKFIHILPAYQRNGNGKMLLDVLVTNARAENVHRIYVKVRDYNHSAFFKSCGFAITTTTYTRNKPTIFLSISTWVAPTNSNINDNI